MRNNFIDMLKTIAVISMIFIHSFMWINNQIYYPVLSELPYYIGRLSSPLFFFCSGVTIIFTHNSSRQMIIESILLFLIGMFLNFSIGFLLFNVISLFGGVLQIIAINKIIIYIINKKKIQRKGLIITVIIYLIYGISPLNINLEFFANIYWILFPLGYIYAKYYNYNIKRKFYLGRISLTVFVSHIFIILYPIYLLNLYLGCNMLISYFVAVIYILIFYFLSIFITKSSRNFSIEHLLYLIKKKKIFN